jgi:hypothetical protein
MKYKYYMSELARDVACGKPVEYLLKKYKPFKLGKTGLKKLLEDQEFQMMVNEVNDKINDKVADTRKRLQLLSDKALDVIEDLLNTERPFPGKVDVAIDVLKMAGVPVKEQARETLPVVIRIEKDTSGESS